MSGAWQVPRMRRARRRVRRRNRQRPHPPLGDRPDDRPRTDRTPRPAAHRPRAAPHTRPPVSVPRAQNARTRGTQDLVARPALQVTDQDIAGWQAALSRRPSLMARLSASAAGATETIRALELGLDRGRITIPIRNAHGELRGLLRYQPERTGRPKMLAAPGTRLGLVPHPAAEASDRILLVEGPPDMIAAPLARISPRSPCPATTHGSPPGRSCSPDAGSRSSWTPTRKDEPPAERIAADLAAHADVRTSSTSPRTATTDTTSRTGCSNTQSPSTSTGSAVARPVIKGAANDDERAEHRLRRLHPPGAAWQFWRPPELNTTSQAGSPASSPRRRRSLDPRTP